MSRFSTITGYEELLPSQEYNTKGLYINMYVRPVNVISVVKLLCLDLINCLLVQSEV